MALFVITAYVNLALPKLVSKLKSILIKNTLKTYSSFRTPNILSTNQFLSATSTLGEKFKSTSLTEESGGAGKGDVFH